MEMYPMDGCVVEMCDLPGKDQNPICVDGKNTCQDENPDWVNQDVEVRDCQLDSDESPRDIFVDRNGTIPDGMSGKAEVEKKSTDHEESRPNSDIGVFSLIPPFSSSSPLPPAPHPARSLAEEDGASQFGAHRDESCLHCQRTTSSSSWRNSFYARLSLEYIACSTVLAIVIPVLGIPAVVYSIQSYRAYKRGGLQQSRHLNLLAFRLILVAGALLCCLTIASGFLAAYVLVRPIQIVSDESPTMEVTSTFPQSERNLFQVQERELLDGRHNVSVLGLSRNPICDTDSSSVSVVPLDDPSWNPLDPLATLVRRAGIKVLKRPVVPDTSRGSIS